MDAGIEKECSALGGLFQLIMNDMKVKKTGHTSHLITCRYIFFFFNQAVFSPLFFAYLSQYIGLPVISDFKSHICFILSNFMAAACNIVSLL